MFLSFEYQSLTVIMNWGLLSVFGYIPKQRQGQTWIKNLLEIAATSAYIVAKLRLWRCHKSVLKIHTQQRKVRHPKLLFNDFIWKVLEWIFTRFWILQKVRTRRNQNICVAIWICFPVKVQKICMNWICKLYMFKPSGFSILLCFDKENASFHHTPKTKIRMFPHYPSNKTLNL